MNGEPSPSTELNPDDSTRQSIGRKIAVGGIWALMGRIGSVVLVVAVNALASRLLSAEDMGAYFLSLSLVAVISIVAQIGLNHGIVKLLASEMAIKQTGRVKGHILSSLQLVLGLSVLLAILLNQPFAKDLAHNLFSSDNLSSEIGWVALWAALYSIQSLVAETWRGLQKIDHATVFGGLSTQFFTLASLGLLMILEVPATLHAVVLVSVTSCFLSILLSLMLLTPQLSELGKAEWTGTKQLLSFSWPFLFTSLTLFTLSQADLWLVGFFSSEAQVAYYGAAMRITLLTTMPLAIVNAVIPPFLAERHTVGDKDGMEAILRSTSLLAFLPALCLFLVYWAFGADILELVFGPGYSTGAPVMLILTGGYLCHILSGSPGYTLMMTGNQKPMMIITVSAAALMVASGILGAKLFGPIGVAWGSFLGLTSQTVGMWLYARIKVGVWTHPDFRRLLSLPQTVQTLLHSK